MREIHVRDSHSIQNSRKHKGGSYARVASKNGTFEGGSAPSPEQFFAFLPAPQFPKTGLLDMSRHICQVENRKSLIQGSD